MTPLNRPGRTRTGIVDARTLADGTVAYYGRLRLADGSRSHGFRLDRVTSKEQAQHEVAKLQAQEEATGVVLRARQERERAERPTQLETVDAWAERWIPTCGGARYQQLLRSVWGKWISPIIGAKDIRALTRDDVEDVRDHLDRAIETRKLAAKSARNVWGHLTSAMKSAVASRDRTLRVHSAPLTYGVLPPKRGTSRQRPWIYPAELLRVLECEDVPQEWRRMYAIAAYLGTRPNELRALTWGDVDALAGTVSISKAWDDAAKDVKTPKTRAGQRTIPVPPTLAPLLAAMRGGASEPVCPILALREKDRGRVFQRHLTLAQVDRARLSSDTETEMPLDVRGLRDSYATWLAVAGTPLTTIQRRMGHEKPDQTDRYIRAAESLGSAAGIGTPFPELPACLLTKGLTKRPTKQKRGSSVSAESTSFHVSTSVARVGFETETAVAMSRFLGVSSLELGQSGPGFGQNERGLTKRHPSLDVECSTPEAAPANPREHAIGEAALTSGEEAQRALAGALAAAAAAGQWDVVAQLARELEALRLAGER